MESTRQKKYARLIQRELGEIFQQDIKHIFHHAFITVTRVAVSPDLGVAKVHLSFLQTGSNENIMELIQARKRDVRRMLGERIRKQVRVIPELVFYLDEGASYASHIDEILSKLDIPPEDKNTDPSE